MQRTSQQMNTAMKTLAYSTLALILLSFYTQGLQAQPQTYREEITVVAPYEPTISDAFKIDLRPVTGDTLPVKKSFTYEIRSGLLPTPFSPEPLKPARMVGEPLDKLYKNYLKAGFGNYLTPWVEYHYNSLRSRDLVYALRLEHQSSAGELEGVGDPGRNHNALGFGLQRIGKKGSTLSADLGFSRDVRHFYGFQTEGLYVIPDKDTYKQRYTDVDSRFSWFSHDPDPRRLQHAIGLEVGHFADLDERGELRLALDAGLSKQVELIQEAGAQTVGIEASGELYRNAYPGDSSEISALIRVEPEFRVQLGEFHLKAGLKAEVMNDTNSRLSLYPVAEVRIHVMESAMSIFFGMDGGAERYGLKKYARLNPYIADSLPFGFREVSYRFYGGTEGRIGQRLGFHATIAASKIEDMPYFVNDTLEELRNRFTVVRHETSLFSVNAGLSFQHSQKLQSQAELTFSQHSPSEGTAWHVPALTASFSLKYNLRDKIILDTDLHFEGPRKARDFDPEVNEMEVDLKSFTDVGLGIEYRYSKVLSAFLQFNNLLGKNYVQWYGYPVQGLRGMAGITFAF